MTDIHKSYNVVQVPIATYHFHKASYLLYYTINQYQSYVISPESLLNKQNLP